MSAVSLKIVGGTLEQDSIMPQKIINNRHLNMVNSILLTHLRNQGREDAQILKTEWALSNSLIELICNMTDAEISELSDQHISLFRLRKVSGAKPSFFTYQQLLFYFSHYAALHNGLDVLMKAHEWGVAESMLATLDLDSIQSDNLYQHYRLTFRHKEKLLERMIRALKSDDDEYIHSSKQNLFAVSLN